MEPTAADREAEGLMAEWTRAETQESTRQITALCILFAVLALVPGQAGLRLTHAAVAVILAVVAGSSWYTRHQASDSTEEEWNLANRIDIIGGTGMIIVHLLWMILHPEVEAFKLAILVFPVACARVTGTSFACYTQVAAHMVLLLVRFRDDWYTGATYVVVMFVSCFMSADISVMRETSRARRALLVTAISKLTILSEDTVRSFFHGFCDAHAVLDEKLDLLESSPSLQSLLHRKADEGRSFCEFVEGKELLKLKDSLDKLVREARQEDDTEDSSRPSILRMRTYLIDPYAQNIDVHLFIVHYNHLQGREVFFVGITEHSGERAKAPKKLSAIIPKTIQGLSSKGNHAKGPLSAISSGSNAGDEDDKVPGKAQASASSTLSATTLNLDKADKPTTVFRAKKQYSPRGDK
eukprot:TRINITY_DN64314_c0_g1_i1.p1 TRINITY_DN64314_c0_g1~~TRINITY_DN64314_c0_g1_i1.p1  ORF type:complete len:410 (-),score=63.70 TRINITY_DN64314_c0_g1_i1:68-1297(-)